MGELRIDGHSMKAIAETVVKEGLVPEHKPTGFAGRNAVSRVHNALRNPFYVGRFRWVDEWYEGTHEPVFTREEWDRLQATFGKGPAVTRSAEKGHPLAGLLRCGECGCRITPEIKRRGSKSYPYPRCANRKKQHERLTYVPESTIMDGFARVAEVVRIDGAIAERVAKALNDSHADLRASRRREAARFKRQLSELEDKEDRLYDDLSRGALDDVAYRRQLLRVREQRTRCTEQLEAANEELDSSYLADAQKILELAKQAKKLWLEQSLAEKRRFLDAVLSNATLNGRSIEFELKKPFRILSEWRQGEFGRARYD